MNFIFKFYKPIGEILLASFLSLCFVTTACAKLNPELQCLTVGIFLESRGESLLGQQLVAKVILNRVEHPSFPDTICKVVFQPKQFSWYNQGRTKALGSLLKGSTRGLKPKDIAAYREAQFVALTLFKQGIDLHPKWDKALYFLHKDVVKKQRWLTKKKFIGKVGSHRFYGN